MRVRTDAMDGVFLWDILRLLEATEGALRAERVPEWERWERMEPAEEARPRELPRCELRPRRALLHALPDRLNLPALLPATLAAIFLAMLLPRFLLLRPVELWKDPAAPALRMYCPAPLPII